MLLAIFNILAILGSFAVHYINLQGFSNLSSLGQEFFTLAKQLDTITNELSQLNGPGNNLFESKNPTEEEQQYQKINQKVLATINIFEQKVKHLSLYSSQMLGVTGNFHRLHQEYGDIVSKLFIQAQLNQYDDAAALMAQMDRQHVKLNGVIHDLRSYLAQEQQDQMAHYQKELHQFYSLTIIFMIALTFAIFGLLIYGRKFSKNMQQQSHLQQLQFTKLEQLSLQLEQSQSIAKLGSWEFFPQHHQLKWSKELYHIFDIPKDIDATLLYTTYQERIHPEDLIEFFHLIELAVQEKKGFELVHRIILRDGKIRFIRAIATVTTFQDKFRRTQIKLSGTAQDITQEHHNQQLQRQKNKELHNFFSISSDMLCVLNMKGQVKQLNSAFAQLLGTTLSVAEREHFFYFVHPEDQLSTIQQFEQLSLTQPNIQITHRYQSANAEHKILSWTMSLDPESMLVYAAGKDVTYEKNKQRELEQVMQAISRSAIVSTTDPSGKIDSVNELFCQISGYSQEELIGQDHRLVNSWVHDKQFFKEMWTTIRHGEVWTGTIQNKAKDGRYYFVRTVITPIINESGKIIKYLAIRFDVTQQVLSERKLEEAQAVAKIGSWSFDLRSQRIEWSKQMYQLFPESPVQGPPSYQRHYETIYAEDQPMWEQTIGECGVTSI